MSAQGENGDSWIVGRHAVSQALAAGTDRALELLLAGDEPGAAQQRLAGQARAAGLRVRKVAKAQLDLLSRGAAHQGVALRLAAQDYVDFSLVSQAAAEAGSRALVVLADHLQDPHNLGAVARSAAAAGAQGLVIPRDRACPLTPVVAKAAAGALSCLPVCRVTNLTQSLEELQQAGLWALAAVTRQAPPPWELDLRLPLVLVIGHESKGVGQRLAKACDMHTSLPLDPRMESLNASVAAGVLLFEIVRQRRQAGVS